MSFFKGLNSVCFNYWYDTLYDMYYTYIYIYIWSLLYYSISIDNKPKDTSYIIFVFLVSTAQIIPSYSICINLSVLDVFSILWFLNVWLDHIFYYCTLHYNGWVVIKVLYSYTIRLENQQKTSKWSGGGFSGPTRIPTTAATAPSLLTDYYVVCLYRFTHTHSLNS